MPTFYFTFGQKYRDEKHIRGGHPDGYFAVVAPDSEAARAAMWEDCGPLWAMQYDVPPSAKHFPRGELRRIIVTNNPKTS